MPGVVQRKVRDGPPAEQLALPLARRFVMRPIEGKPLPPRDLVEHLGLAPVVVDGRVGMPEAVLLAEFD